MKILLVLVLGVLVGGAIESKIYSSLSIQDDTITQKEADDLNAKLDKAHSLVNPYIYISDVNHKAPDKDRIYHAIDLYNQVLERVPDHWVSLFMKGKSYQALSEHRHAYASFKAAYDIHKDHKDILNEFALEAFELGFFDEALELLEKGQSMFRDDIGVQGNYALALLMTGQVDRSLKAFHAFQARWPDDPIAKRLVPVAEKLQQGIIRQPKSIKELYSFAR